MQTSFPKEKIKILLLEGVHPNTITHFEKAGYTNIEYHKKALAEADLIETIKDAHVVGIRSKTQINENVLNHAQKLLAVGCFCIGTNQVDLKTATQKGVAVFNSPYSNTRSVAELVIAEAVMLLRRIPHRSNQAHQGKWMKDADQSYELRGKTLGIVGYGHIGSQVSVLGEALGLKVIYYDVEPKLPLGNAQTVESLDELLETSDIVTLHVPADASTKNMMTAERFAQMPQGSYFINLSRGSVVDIDALADNIKSGHIAGASVDVYPLEPKSNKEKFTSPLQGLHNVILTPHIGGSTQEAQENIAKDAATKLINFVEKGSTVGNHTIPELNLPRTGYRLLHIHYNKPGIVSEINKILSKTGLNVEGQFLKTNEEIGYVVVDVNEKIPEEAQMALKNLEHTIKARFLFK